MPKRKRSPESQLQDLGSSDPEQVQTETLPEPMDNGHEETPEVQETAEVAEPPAKMRVQIEGTAGAVRAAARKVGNSPPTPVVATPADDIEPPIDNTDALLADGRNMVVVQRQFPKAVTLGDGTKRRCAVKLPDRYACPTTREEIENDVFDRHGGKKYKCTIHPATTNGESQILGFFTIEHPDSEAQPFFEDDPQPEFDPRTAITPGNEDKTMHETDNLAEVKARLQRRLDRAETLKEIKQMEKLTKDAERELESDGKPPAPPVSSSESDEVKKLREQNALLQAQLAEKKVNDRFDKLEDSITKLATAIAAKPVEKPADDPFMKFMFEKMKSDDTRMTALMDTITKVANKPPAAAAASPEDNFDKMLERLTKMKTVFGAKDSRVSELEDKLIDASMDRLLGGGDEERGPVDEEDAFKFALKQMTPVIKAYVEKKVGQREDDTGEAPNKEELKKIYEEAGKKAAQEIAEKWQKEGLVVRADGSRPALPAPAGKQQVPARHVRQGDRPGVVTNVQNTPEGQVKTVNVQPHDLSKKPTPHSEPQGKKEETVAKYTQLPGLGENGSALKVELPAQPGDLKYDRKRSIDFVLDSIRSEILQGMPSKSPDDSVVPGDALELLDDEILAKIAVVENGEQLEREIGPWCDPVKIQAVKDAGNQNEETKSWLRRIFITISDNFKAYQRKGL